MDHLQAENIKRLLQWRVQAANWGTSEKGPLQWGHDLAVMESNVMRITLEGVKQLQWGHDLVVMESQGRRKR